MENNRLDLFESEGVIASALGIKGEQNGVRVYGNQGDEKPTRWSSRIVPTALAATS